MYGSGSIGGHYRRDQTGWDTRVSIPSLHFLEWGRVPSASVSNRPSVRHSFKSPFYCGNQVKRVLCPKLEPDDAVGAGRCIELLLRGIAGMVLGHGSCSCCVSAL